MRNLTKQGLINILYRRADEYRSLVGTALDRGDEDSQSDSQYYMGKCAAMEEAANLVEELE